MEDKKYRKIIRILFAVLAMVFLLFIAYKAIVPFGKITYAKHGEENSYFISRLKPDTRAKGSEISGSPTYFNLTTPRRFDRADISLEYERLDEAKYPIIDLGLLIGDAGWSYQSVNLENRLIENLSDNWSLVKDDKVVLLTRPTVAKNFPSVAEFLRHLPPRDKVAIYNFTMPDDFKISGYQKSPQTYSLPASFRGSYQFFVYIKDEVLRAEWQLTDRAENPEKDKITISIYKGGKLVDAFSQEDAGIEDGRETKRDNVLVEVKNLAEGAYKIEFKANNDIITRKIILAQSKASFYGKFNILNQKNIQLLTTSRTVSLMTTDPKSLGTISIDQDQLNIEKAFEQYAHWSKKLPSVIVLPPGDHNIVGRGAFSFATSTLFDPKYKEVDESFDPNIEGVDYVIAGYTITDNRNAKRIAEASFDLASAYRKDGQYGFMLAVPGLDSSDEWDPAIRINSINITLHGQTLLGKIKKIINDFRK